MPVAYLVLLVGNAVYGTSYVATRVVLQDVGPGTLALVRLAIGALVLVPLALSRVPLALSRVPLALSRVPLALRRRPAGDRLSRGDHWKVFWMGLLGFAGAFAFGNWGIAHSTATNAALLITVEPVALILLSPYFLGERLSRREKLGALLTLIGATLVVVNGVPGVSVALLPHWRGDILLVLSGLSYAAYSLIGRGVLARHGALPVTAWSILWGVAAMAPLAGLEWLGGHRPAWSATALWGTAYLALVVTALGYLVWNYALERVQAPRLALFINVQPVVGGLLGVWWLREPLTVFIVAGGVLVLLGLHIAVRAGRMV